MDYWELVDWQAVDSWAEVREKLPGRPWWALTKSADTPRVGRPLSRRGTSSFSAARRGVCRRRSLSEQPNRNLRLPMRPEVRSLNLASTVNTVVYEAVRQFGGLS